MVHYDPLVLSCDALRSREVTNMPNEQLDRWARRPIAQSDDYDWT